MKRKASDFMRGSFYISKPSSFMHLYPDKKSEVTDELLYGTSVISFDESYAGYLFCKTDYGYSGYVDVSDLSQKKQGGESFVVTSSFCDIYETPEYRFAPKITVPRGSIIAGEKKKCRDDRFVCIKNEDGEFYVPKGNVAGKSLMSRFDTAEKKRKQIVKTAFYYLGTPYRWGGKSVSGIDCSGFVFMCYALCGLGLYRDAEPDARYVKKIPFGELQPADLIYYNGHVTMYIGSNEYIHSSATLGGVRIGSFDEESENFYPKLKSDIVCCAKSLYLN